MDQPPVRRTKRSDNATTSYSERGKKLCDDAVYLFYEPEGTPEAEIVFIHDLLLAKDDFKNEYWRAWLARDGTRDNCWPMTWLPKKFPNVRILSLSYDACAQRSATTGRMDAYSLGESLVQQMTFKGVGIGQEGCPVVFVCHGLGGLIAKEIVISGHRQSSTDKRAYNLLNNVKAFFFYATPHGGSKLADLAGYVPFRPMGPLVKYSQVMNKDVGRLNSDFERIHRDVGRSAWKFYVVGEMHATSNAKGFVPAMAIGVMAVSAVVGAEAARSTAVGTVVGGMALIAIVVAMALSANVVEEASARHVGYKFIGVAANHIDVCKPKSETDTGFHFLTSCITEVLEDDRRRHDSPLELPSHLVGMKDKLQEVRKTMAEHSVGIGCLPESHGELNFDGGLNLIELPNSFGKLQKLKRLGLYGSGIYSLPESFGELTNLEVLDSTHCENLIWLPESFGKLQKLKCLKLEGCGIGSLPKSFGELNNLELLDLSNCKNLIWLPESFGKLQILKDLKLPKCGFESLPESFGELTNLELLD